MTVSETHICDCAVKLANLWAKTIGNFPDTVMSRALKKSQCQHTFRIIVTLTQLKLDCIHNLNYSTNLRGYGTSCFQET